MRLKSVRWAVLTPLLAILALLAAAGGIAVFVAKNQDGDALSALISERVPGVIMRFDNPRWQLVDGRLGVRADALRLHMAGGHIESDNVQLTLDDKRLHLYLRQPLLRLYAPPAQKDDEETAARPALLAALHALPKLPVRVQAQAARVEAPALALTLAASAIDADLSRAQWRLTLSDADGARLNAAGSADEAGRAKMTLFVQNAPAAMAARLGLPARWRGMQASVALESTQFGAAIQYRARGHFTRAVFHAATPSHWRAQEARWQSGGHIDAATARATMQLALDGIAAPAAPATQGAGAYVPAAIRISAALQQDAAGGWHAPRALLQTHAPAYTLRATAAFTPPPACAQNSGADCPNQLQGAARAQLALPYNPQVTLTLAARLLAAQGANGWQVSVPQLQARHAGATLTAAARLFYADASDDSGDSDDSGGAIAEASGALSALPITTAHWYFPEGDTRDWLRDSLDAGVADSTRFYVRLPLGDANTEGDANAADVNTDATAAPAPEYIARVTIAFQGGKILLEDGWQPAQALSGTVFVDNDTIAIHGNGLFDGIATESVIARIPNSTAPGPATLFMAIVSRPTPLPQLLAGAARAPATQEAMREISGQIEARAGVGVLSLSLSMPLSTPAATRATANLALRYANIAAPGLPEYAGARGQLRFSNDHYAGELAGELAGGGIDNPPVRVSLSPDEVLVSGVIALPQLLSVAGAPTPRLAGSTPFVVRRAATLTVFSATLDGTVIDLPAPLGKGAHAAAHLLVTLANGAFAAAYRTEHVTLLARRPAAAGGADIALNAAPRPPPAAGTRLHGAAANINLDLWAAQTGDMGGVGGAAGGTNATGELAGLGAIIVQLTLKNADFMGVSHQNFTLDMRRPAAAASVTIVIDASHASGAITRAHNTVRAEFSRLEIPADRRKLASASGEGKIASLAVAMVAHTLVLGGLTLGHLALDGAPAPAAEGEQWRLHNLRLRGAGGALDMAGAYEKEQTVLTVNFHTQDLPALINVLQIPPVFGEGRVSIYGGIAWPGAPTDFQQETLRGQLRLHGGNVRYLKTAFSTNIVNLLAIFSPQSLFSLGFTELGDGVAFDSVRGDIAIANGAAAFQPLLLESRDLHMDIRGSTNFVFRQHDLRGRVQPGEKLLHAGSAVGIGAGLAALNPLTLIGGTVLGELLEDPISHIGSYDYTITGTWADPIYKETVPNDSDQ